LWVSGLLVLAEYGEIVEIDGSVVIEVAEVVGIKVKYPGKILFFA